MRHAAHGRGRARRAVAGPRAGRSGLLRGVLERQRPCRAYARRAAARAGGRGGALRPYADQRLREWCYGDLEGEPGELLHATLDAGFGAPLSFEEHNRRLPEVADVLADADCSGRAERFDAIERRLRGFFREAGDDGLKRGGGNVLVVTHSFVVRTLVYLIDPERVNDPVKIPNASVTRISYDGSDFRLGEIGSTAWQRP
ncbi:MAG: histidine phosphatase family protein [Eggerthella lenta]